MKKRYHHGDRRYIVEWCPEIPIDENGDADLDACEYRSKLFESVEAARKYAEEVLPQDAWGIVSVQEIVFEAYDPQISLYAGFWQPIGETEHIET